MLPPLPPEVLDLIVDHLHDKPTALKNCCLVSKPWVPRAQRHLFARVEWNSLRDSCLHEWMHSKPDPTSFPFHHTRILSIRGPRAIIFKQAADEAWVRTFRHIVELEVDVVCWGVGPTPLTLFRELSPNLRSLTLATSTTRILYTIPIPEVLDLLCSYPLLEDLSLHFIHQEAEPDHIPSISPKLTGILRLEGRISSITNGLIRLPGGIHFTKLVLLCKTEDASSMTDLITGCRDTVEFLIVQYVVNANDIDTLQELPSINLSNASRVQEVTFRSTAPDMRWVAKTLQTIQPINLRRITICTSFAPLPFIEGGPLDMGWGVLVNTLAQLWTSHSVRTTVACGEEMPRENVEQVSVFLQDLTDGGAVTVVHYWPDDDSSAS